MVLGEVTGIAAFWIVTPVGVVPEGETPAAVGTLMILPAVMALAVPGAKGTLI